MEREQRGAWHVLRPPLLILLVSEEPTATAWEIRPSFACCFLIKRAIAFSEPSNETGMFG